MAVTYTKHPRNPEHQWGQEDAMRRKMLDRVRDHAFTNRASPKWKRASMVLAYGAGLVTLNRNLRGADRA